MKNVMSPAEENEIFIWVSNESFLSHHHLLTDVCVLDWRVLCSNLFLPGQGVLLCQVSLDFWATSFSVPSYSSADWKNWTETLFYYSLAYIFACVASLSVYTIWCWNEYRKEWADGKGNDKEYSVNYSIWQVSKSSHTDLSLLLLPHLQLKKRKQQEYIEELLLSGCCFVSD